VPLYLFLHGGHVGTGSADNIVALHRAVPLLKQGIVLYPQHLYWFWSHPDESLYVIRILEEVLKKYKVDRRRMYVLGSSMGGNGAMHLAAHFPEMFAACTAVSCWCQFIPVHKAGVMPIYNAHGKKDKVVPIKWARDIRKRLKGVKNLRLSYHEMDYAHQPPISVFVNATKWMQQFTNPRTFDFKQMKDRAAKLPLKKWMKRKEYVRGYHNARAWWLLTSKDPRLRDPKKALALAEKARALGGAKAPAILDTLALAYFANGRVKEAVETAKKALKLLPKKTPVKMRAEFEKRLGRYEAKLKKP
jgi:pimeloyl-ACP methyl ester carboxylesterase